MKTLSLLLSAAALMFVTAPHAQAVEWMDGKELISHCQDYLEHPTSLDGISCSSYIQGFLGGAEATDAVVVKKFDESKERSDFEKRVLNTRVRQWQQTYGPTALADYCLPRTESNVDVVKNVINFIAKHPESEMLMAPDLVYKSLQESYPCP